MDAEWRILSKVPRTIEEALVLGHRYGYPVLLVAAFALGGWSRVATDESELRKHFSEGQQVSPVGEVALRWTMSV